MKWHDPQKEKPDEYEKVLVMLNTARREIVSAYYETYPGTDKDIYHLNLLFPPDRSSEFDSTQILAWAEYPNLPDFRKDEQDE